MNSRVVLKAFQTDGITPAWTGSAEFALPLNGHAARFVSEAIGGLPAGFTGVLEISSVDLFAALTLRSLTTSRGDLLLTTFPIADANQPSPTPIVFPTSPMAAGTSRNSSSSAPPGRRRSW